MDHCPGKSSKAENIANATSALGKSRLPSGVGGGSTGVGGFRPISRGFCLVTLGRAGFALATRREVPNL